MQNKKIMSKKKKNATKYLLELRKTEYSQLFRKKVEL